jgi:hypothetical protein
MILSRSHLSRSHLYPENPNEVNKTDFLVRTGAQSGTKRSFRRHRSKMAIGMTVASDTALVLCQRDDWVLVIVNRSIAWVHLSVLQFFWC